MCLAVRDVLESTMTLQCTQQNNKITRCRLKYRVSKTTGKLGQPCAELHIVYSAKQQENQVQG